MNLEEQVKVLKAALDDKKADNIVAYDVRGVSGLADCFVVATGTSAPHLKALISSAEKAMINAGTKAFRISGDPDSGWIVVDFIDIVVHVFSPEARQYYALEKLWDKAKILA